MADKPKKSSELDDAQAAKLLKTERERIEKALAGHGHERRSELSELDTEQAGDDSSGNLVDVEVGDAVTRSLHTELEAVERAEQRLADGTYGLSVESGEPIPAARLESHPHAERTVDEEKRRR